MWAFGVGNQNYKPLFTTCLYRAAYSVATVLLQRENRRALRGTTFEIEGSSDTLKSVATVLLTCGSKKMVSSVGSLPVVCHLGPQKTVIHFQAVETRYALCNSRH